MGNLFRTAPMHLLAYLQAILKVHTAPFKLPSLFISFSPALSGLLKAVALTSQGYIEHQSVLQMGTDGRSLSCISMGIRSQLPYKSEEILGACKEKRCQNLLPHRLPTASSLFPLRFPACALFVWLSHRQDGGCPELKILIFMA